MFNISPIHCPLTVTLLSVCLKYEFVKYLLNIQHYVSQFSIGLDSRIETSRRYV